MASCEREATGSGLKPLDVDEFRATAHRMVDFIADYYRDIETFPVRSQVKPGYLKQLLPETAPEDPEGLDDVLTDVQCNIIPGLTHWQSPNFFAYFPSNSSTAGFLGEMLSGGLNVNGFSWINSPAATELEVIVLDWLGKLLKLPEEFLSSGEGGGVIQGTASEAVLVSILAAKNHVLEMSLKKGLSKWSILSTLTVYTSDQAHSSVEKACTIAGIDPQNLRVLPANGSTNYALPPEIFSKALADDVAAGLLPFFLCATVGTTSSTAVDPILALGTIAKEYGLWFHVDAAYAGSACICPEYRHHLDGVELADSFSMNAHKWLLTNFECAALWVKNSNLLVTALSTQAEYLRNKASEMRMVVDFKDWQIPLGRRFRSLKLWMILRLYGASGLRAYIRNHIEIAKHLEDLIRADDRFEILAPRTFALVCFRLKPLVGDLDNGYRSNAELQEAVNSSGSIFFTHTVLSGVYTLRIAVGAPLTEMRHVDKAWEVIKEHAESLQLKR
ncbi:hypothetical protein O6H91_01G133900 [Diphasiastrum complanatum]|uniref:Uncharacterized protein n=3 Tax=Diphasiastrum complanatum TaxID=34168 RepID=A0ACC2EW97_DIPCM|nr:hypothetical protein O6H91_01G133900 [Diphasiastrum complanatum]KAJ7570761.1 hypothetical protein O6H91_01G133900 [Diphasiastrum complanatum]KAJ7570763.1 hypothetical protein O6H91_01G133900 [Diphasiastrum complanatum]